jgi:signal transduction histidine kinase
VATYYVVSEMLTNTAKHAQASAGYVGLVGLRDRVEALGGTVAFKSARGAGTAAEVVLPLDRKGEASEQPLDAPLPPLTVDPR